MGLTTVFNRKEKDKSTPIPEPPAAPSPSVEAPASKEVGNDVEKATTKDGKNDDSDVVYPSGLKLWLLVMSIFVGMFLSSLVRFSHFS